MAAKLQISLTIVIFFFLMSGLYASAAVQDDEKIPETPDEAVQVLVEMIPNNEVGIIRRLSEEEFTGNARYTLGEWMKESWNLYSNESPLGRFFMERGIYDANEMADIILVCYWRLLTQSSYNLDEILDERLSGW